MESLRQANVISIQQVLLCNKNPEGFKNDTEDLLHSVVEANCHLLRTGECKF